MEFSSFILFWLVRFDEVSTVDKINGETEGEEDDDNNGNNGDRDGDDGEIDGSKDIDKDGVLGDSGDFGDVDKGKVLVLSSKSKWDKSSIFVKDDSLIDNNLGEWTKNEEVWEICRKDGELDRMGVCFGE